MAYAQNGVINADDLGKVLAYNDATNIANYKVFAITVSANVGVTKYFTVIYSRDSGGQYYTGSAPNVTTWNKSCIICKCRFKITLSNNIFSLSDGYYVDDNGHSITLSFKQIRGLM